MSSIHIIYASTSGHTEYVVDQVLMAVKESRPDIIITKEMAETASLDSLGKADLIVLASSSWNTNNVEGQLNPQMWKFAMVTAKNAELSGRRVAVIGLGDLRYFYTCKAADHLEEFVKTHGGTLVEPTLRIINEPYGQEEAVREWVEKVFARL